MINKNELPKDWDLRKLGQVAKFIDYRGRTPKKTDSGIPLITAKNVKKGFISETPREFIAEMDYESWMTRGIPNKGDVLFTTEAPLGNVAQLRTEKKIALAQRIITFQTFPELNNSFLKFCLQSPQFQENLNAKGTGTTVKGIKAAILKQLEIVLPPLAEQECIVAKIEELFSELDAGTESLKRARRQLKIYRQAVLKWAFEGKLTNDNLNDGELPNGWKLVKMGEVIEQPKYGTSKKCDYKFEGKGVLRIPNVDNGLIDDSDLKFASFDEKEIETYCLKESDLLTIRSNGSVDLVGKCALIMKRDEEYLYAGYLIRLRPLKKFINPKFLLNVLSSSNLRNQIESKAKSTSGVNNINSDELKSLVIPFCTLEEQQRVVQEIESRLSVCDKLEETIHASLKQAEALRQSILKKAFEGKLVRAKTIEKPKRTAFYQMQTLGLIVNRSKQNRIRHGEMTLAKYAFLADKIYGVPIYDCYERWHLGPYPTDIKKTVNNREYFKIESNQIRVLNEEKLFKYHNENKERIENAVDELAKIFSSFEAKDRPHKTELLATVCKVVEDLQTTDINAVRQSMAEWKIELKNGKYKNKAEKFDEDETEKCVAFIVKNGWDKKLIK